MGNPVETISDSPISRRRVLKLGAGAMAVGAMGIVANELHIPTIAGGMAEGIGDQLGAVREYSISAALTEQQHLHPVSVYSVGSDETLETSSIFTVSNLPVRLDNGKLITLIKTEIAPSANAYNLKLPNMKPESVMKVYDGDVVVAPVGYKAGKYHRFNSELWSLPSVRLEYPALSSKGVPFGPQELVDRFPGLGDEINNASGGYYIQNGKFVITDKKGLETAQSFNVPFSQLVYYIDNKNVEDVLSQKWSNKFHQAVEIGDTSYYWSMYVQIPGNNNDIETFILTSETMVPVSQMVQTVKLLSPDGNFKIAMADGGNGSSVLTQSNSEMHAYGINGSYTHLTPMTLAFME